eukprot:9048718-Pyramimonas_sp.AAC.1
MKIFRRGATRRFRRSPAPGPRRATCAPTRRLCARSARISSAIRSAHSFARATPADAPVTTRPRATPCG